MTSSDVPDCSGISLRLTKPLYVARVLALSGLFVKSRKLFIELCCALRQSLPVLTVLTGDAITQLTRLSDCSVQCCVTSPPYWGLRDYGTAKWEGGNSDCDHNQLRQPKDGKQATNAGASRDRIEGGSCRWCGANRIDAQLGLEKTPNEYVANMVSVFREVRRVLKDDGVCWINLGDSYAGSGKGGNPEQGKQATNRGSQSVGVLYGKTGETAREAAVTNVTRLTFPQAGIKAKDLVGIPWIGSVRAARGWLVSAAGHYLVEA